MYRRARFEAFTDFITNDGEVTERAQGHVRDMSKQCWRVK